MARNRNSIAQFVSFDMTAMANRIQGMTDAQLGAWCRKMVIDCCSGCLDPNTDPFVRSYYNRSHSKMLEKQNQNSRNYQSRIARRAAEFFENETTDKPIAESATMRTSEAVKALADGDAREGSLNVADGSNAAQPESATSAKTLVTTPLPTESTNEPEARQNQRTEGAPERCKKQTASHAEKPSVRPSADLFGEGEKKPYGTCKNVLLSDADGHHLREVYGQDLAIAIEILDSALENNPKLKKRYKNHAENQGASGPPGNRRNQQEGRRETRRERRRPHIQAEGQRRPQRMAPHVHVHQRGHKWITSRNR